MSQRGNYRSKTNDVDAVLETINKFREYLNYIERHYNNVQKAWSIIKERCEGKGFRFLDDDFVFHTIEANVSVHDLSKLSSEEFTQYRQYFFPTEFEEKDKVLFDAAWENHKNENPHHWQNWTDNYKDFPYADIYLIENIVDWMAMGFEYGDTALSYYESNQEQIDLPGWAIDEMYRIFEYVYPC